MAEQENGAMDEIKYMHCRVDGVTRNIDPTQLDLGDDPTDAVIKGEAERVLELPAGTLNDYEVEKYPSSGTIIIRPAAKFA